MLSGVLLMLLQHTCAGSLQQQNAATPTATVTEDATATVPAVHKCCGADEIVVVNHCQSANLTDPTWVPEFTAGSEDNVGRTMLPASSVPHK